MMEIKLCGKINTTRLAASISSFFTFDYDKDGNVEDQLRKYFTEKVIPLFKADLGPEYGAQVTGFFNGQADQLYESMMVLNAGIAKGQYNNGVRSIGANSALYLGEKEVINAFQTTLQDEKTKDDEEEDEDSTTGGGSGHGGPGKGDRKNGGSNNGNGGNGTPTIDDGDISSSDDVEVIVQDALAEVGLVLSNLSMETIPMAQILKTQFGGDKRLFFDRMVTYFQDLVAKSWIDTEVVDGEVVGFTGLASASDRITEHLKKTVNGLYDKAASRTVKVINPDTGEVIKLQLFSNENEQGVTNINSLTKVTSEEKYKGIPFFDNMYYSSDPESRIYAGTEEELNKIVEFYKNDLKHEIADDVTNENVTELNHNTFITENGDIIMNNEEVFYASVLLNNYPTFLKEYYPGLSKKYQERSRTGFVKDETVTALDQDSAVQKMHKLTTPRIVMDNKGNYVQSKDHPYLTEQDYINVMDTLTTLPRDVKGFRTALESIINSKTSPYNDVLVSIYNRFFNTEEVSYTDNKGNDVTHVSYHTLVNKYATSPVDLDTFNKNKGQLTNNAQLENSLSSLLTSFTSAAVREKFMSKNGKGVPTNSLTGAVMSDFEDKMKSSTSVVLSSGKIHTDPIVFNNEKKKFSVGFSAVNGKNEYDIDVRQGGQKYTFTVRINLNKQGKGFEDGIPIKIVKKPEGISDKILIRVLKGTNMPHNLFSREFVSTFKAKASLSNAHSNNPDVLMEFYLGMLHIMNCNSQNSGSYTKGASKSVDMSDNLPYNYGDNLSGYRDVLSASMNETFGPLKAKFIKNLNGDRLALNIVKTKWDDTKRLIRMAKKNPDSINANSSVVNGTVEVNGLYSKAGLSLNGTTKANSELTEHESNQLLIEQAYLQRCASTAKWNKAMFQMGTMSDRSDVPLADTTHSGTYFPVVDGKYDSTPLVQECLRTHVAHHRGNLTATQNAWQKVLAGEGIPIPAGRNLSSMDVTEFANFINGLQLDYEQIKADYPVVSNISIEKAKVNGKSVAVIPESLVQNCIIFNDVNSPLLQSFMFYAKSKFIADLKHMGYYDAPLADESMALLAKRFPNNTEEQQKEALFDSYFWNQNTVGHSLLQLHTGGYSQFAAKRVPNAKFLSAFKYNRDTKSYDLDTDEVLDNVSDLMQMTEEDIIEEYGISSDEMYYKKILSTSKLSPEDAATLIAYDEINKANSAKFIDQSKRNAMSGSGVQTPRMVGDQEAGAYIGNFSKAITFDDPGEDILLLGATEKTGQDAYDAVMCGHPLYFIKLNNSLGNKESNFSTKGEPVKDITNEVDANGHHRGQKKATFDAFHNEMLRKGSPELYNLLRRLNTAVDFEGDDKTILVDKLDSNFNPVEYTEDDYSLTVTPEIWMQNGHALGNVLVQQEDGTKVVYSTKALLTLGFEEVSRLLNEGKVFTAKVPQTFDNLQELWEYFGSIDSDNSWNNVANVIGNYTGRNCNSILLENTSGTPFYTLRDAYIEKAGFATQEKMGNKNILPAKALTDPTYEFKYTDAKNPNVVRPRYSEIDNTYHGVILSAGHDYDTSATTKSDLFADEEDHAHDATVSLITQIISANVAQGESLAESKKIYSTLGSMSNVVLDSIRRKISNTIVKEAMKIEGFNGPAFYKGIMESTNVTSELIEKLLKNNGVEDPQALIHKGYAAYARDIVKSTLASRETGSIASEIVNQEDVDSVTFDLKQMLPLTQSALNAEFNRKAVRNKFPGMQFVVAPSHDFLHTYSVMNPDGTVHRKGLTRDQVNKVAYETGRDSKWTDIVEHNYPRTEVGWDNLVSMFGMNPNGINHKEVSQITLADKVLIRADVPGVFTADTIMTVSEVIRRLNKLYDSQGAKTTPEILASHITEMCDWRLGNLDNRSKEILEWQSYRRISFAEDGTVTEENFIDTPEYKMFKEVVPLTKTYKKLAKVRKDLDLLYGQLEDPEVQAELQLKYQIEDEIDKLLEEEGKLITGVSPAMRNVMSDHINNDIPLDKAIIRYGMGIRQDGDSLLRQDEVLEAVAKQSKNSEFIKIFEAGAQNVLSDPDAKWSTNPAEFYLPPMHQVAYMIDDGDSIADIVGLQEQPDKNRLIQAGIMDYDDAFHFDNEYYISNDKFRSSGAYDQLSPNQRRIYDEFGRLKIMQLERMNAFFSTKLDGLIEDSGIFKPKGISGMNIGKNISKMINHAETMLRKSAYGTAEHKLWTEVLHGTKPSADVATQPIEELGLYDARKYKRIKSIKELKSLINVKNHKSAAANYRTRKLTSVINNFPASLEFISARIPAQGKQSYIAGVTKEFVYSGRNSCYGPLEMLTATGADYDIDKQNMMTWAVDGNGKITDWRPFLDNNGIISIKAFKSALTEKQNALDVAHEKERQSVIDRFTSDPEHDPAKLESVLASIDKKANRTKEIATKEFEDNFTRACQNYVVYNLLKTIKDPKNAIEAATPMAMEKARGSISPVDYSVIKDDASIEDLLKIRNHALPYAPSTMIQYERLNMDGKTGVGIFASDLKAYFATYYAFISDADNPKTKFASNITADEAAQIKAAHNMYTLDHNGLVFFIKQADGTFKPQTLKTLANAFRYTHKNQMVTKSARALAHDLRNLGTAEEQEALLNERLADVINSNRLMTEEQAWEDLSELLSASTDNAKELILGRIGANALTSSIISTMIRCGVDIKDALALINSKEIKSLVEEVQEAQDTQKTIGEFEERGTLERKALKKLVEEKASAVDKGDPLAYHSNPYVQFLKFVNITEEFSLTAAAFGINQGIKNDAYSMWSYINRITKGINDVIGTKKDPKPFNFKSFVNGIIEAGMTGELSETSMVAQIIQKYDEQKHGINVPYVLYKNAHYLGYFSAMFESKNIRDNISHVYSRVEQVLEDLDVSHIDKDGFNGIADYIYGTGIETFFRKTGKTITLNGTTYDLSNPNADITGIPGRHEFIKAVPAAVQDALDGSQAGNFFLQAISLTTEDPDSMTGEPLKVLKARDLNKMDPTERERMRLGLNDPEIMKTPLYDALYLYSLITNKGSYTQGSFISLFPLDHYQEYMNFINENSQAIADDAIREDRRVPFLLHNKALMPSTSTDKTTLDKLKAKSEKEKSRVDDADPEREEPLFEGPEDEAAYRRKIESKYVSLFNPDTINRKYKDMKPRPQFVTSIQTGVIYGYNKEYGMYIPLSQVTPRIAIPYSIKNSKAGVQEAGFTYGTPVKLGKGVEGNIIGYYDSRMRTRLRNHTIYDSTTVDPISPTNMGMGTYIVERGGKLYRYSKDSLLDFNKDRLVLNKYMVRKLSPAGETETKVRDTMTLYFDGNSFSTRAKDGAILQTVNHKIPFSARAEKETTITSTDAMTKALKKNLKLPKTGNLGMNLPAYYDHMRKVEAAVLVANKLDTPDRPLTPKMVLDAYAKKDATIIKFMRGVAKSVEAKYPKDASYAFKVKAALNSINDLDYAGMQNDLDIMTPENTITNFGDTITELVTNGDMSYGQLETIMRTWKTPPEAATTIIRRALLDSKMKVYLGNDTVVDKRLEGRLRTMADATRHQKLHVPTSMSQDAVAQVSTPVLRKLCKFLNERFPNTRVRVLNTAEIRSTYGENATKSKGFVRNGEVVINMDLATIDTPIHEFSHIYFEHLKFDNNELFNKLVAKALDTPQAVAMRKLYPELSDTDLAEEVLVQMIADDVSGKYGDDIRTEEFFGRDLSEDGHIFGKIVKWFKDLFSNMFRTKKDLDLQMGDSLNDVISNLGDSIAYKKGSPLHDFSKETRNLIKMTRPGHELSMDDALKYLQERGFIQEMCI